MIAKKKKKQQQVTVKEGGARNLLSKLPTRLRSNDRRCPKIKDVLKYFAKFIGKHLCWRLSFNKVAGLRIHPDDCFKWVSANYINIRLQCKCSLIGSRCVFNIPHRTKLLQTVKKRLYLLQYLKNVN